MQRLIRGRTSLSIFSPAVVIFALLLLVPFCTVVAQSLQVIQVSAVSDPVLNPSIHVDDNCSACVPQQVSLCARTENVIYFTGSLIDFQSMLPVLDSSGVVFSPVLTQGLVASYSITLEQQLAAGPRSIFLIESIASGFGEPILLSSGTNDCSDSSVVVLGSGDRVISWTRSTSTSNEVMMKFADQDPVLCGNGGMSRVLSISDESVLVLWREGTILKGLVSDASSQGGVFDLYDMLIPIDQWDAAVHPDGSIRLVVDSSDELHLLTGSLSGGIDSQQIISTGAGAISDLALGSLSTDRYTIAWIQDQQAHRYAVESDAPPVSGALEGIAGVHTELDLSLDALGYEHFIVISDGIAFYAHNTPIPVAEFTITPEDDSTAARTVLFEDQSVGMIETRIWDFGDGEISNEISGEHTYIEPGTYNISLTVTGPGGTDTNSLPNPIVVTTPENAFEMADISVFGTQPVTYPVPGTHSDALQGFQISTTYDDLVITMNEISIDGTQAQSLAPEFIASDINTSGSVAFLYLAVIFDTLPPFDGRTMTPGTNQTLCTLNYTVAQNTPLGTTTILYFQDDLGDPPINNIFAIEGGFSVIPYFIHGTVTVSEQAQFLFIRGDSTYDQSVNIADAIFVLDYLFSGGPFTVCPDAADANDDGAINIGDAISLLHYLFSGGETIPYPYPGYGLDPTPDSLGDCLP